MPIKQAMRQEPTMKVGEISSALRRTQTEQSPTSASGSAPQAEAPGEEDTADAVETAESMAARPPATRKRLRPDDPNAVGLLWFEELCWDYALGNCKNRQ